MTKPKHLVVVGRTESKPLKKHATEIAHIKKKHGFKDDFDLLNALYHLPTEIALMPCLPRPSETNKELKKLRETAAKLRTALLQTSAQTKITLNKIPFYLMDIIGYKDIRPQNKGWDVIGLENDLDIFIQTCDYAQLQTPVDKGGCQKRSVPKYAIFMLASIFERGTGKKPKSGWDEEEDQYVGAFYDFVWDITPLLKDLNIKTVSDETIGRYNVDVLKFYRHMLREYNELRSVIEQNHEEPTT